MSDWEKDYFTITHEVTRYVEIKQVEKMYGRKFTDKEISIIRKDLESLFPECDKLYEMEVQHTFEYGNDGQIRENINSILFNKWDYDRMYDEDGEVIKNFNPPPPIEHNWF